MQLQFEHTQSLGAGTQPQAIHTPENIVQILYTDPDSQGRIYAKDASTPLGQWADREFNPAYLVCTDVDITHLKLKYVSASSIFAVWKNDVEEGEAPTADPPHTVRHRLAVWAMRQDLSNYLVSGTIELRDDDPVTRISLTLENPAQMVSDENDTILTPGTGVFLFFRSGDSARYPMGRYYVDHNSMDVLSPTTSIDGRNAIGKILKDQTFDDKNVYPLQNMQDLMTAIFENFGVTNYWVSSSAYNRGMEFPPDMSVLDGIMELFKTFNVWRIKEDMSGQIGAGSYYNPKFPQPQNYTFYRDTDIFSRSVVRDDREAYSRVCVHADDFAVKVYRDVNFRFTMAKQKTLYVQVADNTTLADAESYADELAEMLADVGVIETFVGPFRPHVLPGDYAEIVSKTGKKLLGVITTVVHHFGRQGFTTELTVDSGGRVNKPSMSEYIQKITGGREISGNVKRLYS